MSKEMTEEEFIRAFNSVVEKHRFWPQGLEFVINSMEYCMFLHGDGGDLAQSPNQYSAAQLCEGAREYAESTIQAPAYQLKVWGIHNAQDFGEAVFALADAGLMAVSETDKLEEFEGLTLFKKSE